MEAKKILKKMFSVISAWQKTAKKLGVKATTIRDYETAFENSFKEEARQLIR